MFLQKLNKKKTNLILCSKLILLESNSCLTGKLDTPYSNSFRTYYPLLPSISKFCWDR